VPLRCPVASTDLDRLAPARLQVGDSAMAQVPPLRGVVRIEDAGSNWRMTLTCGQKVVRAKTEGRPTVFSRRRCDKCLRLPRPHDV
jgi:hypothetical protein